MTETTVNPVSVMPPPIAEKPAPTIDVLTVEIKFYLGQMTQNIIEVGKRLILAKEMLPYGEWGTWLRVNFNLDERSAQNFMKVAHRFGNMSNSQETKSISEVDILTFKPTQLIAMLALPEGDEQKFIDQMAENGTPIDEMSVRELKTAIKQYKQEKEDAETALALLKKELARTQEDNKSWQDTYYRVKDEVKAWKESNALLEDRIEYQEERANNAVANYEKTDKENGRLLGEIADLQEDLDFTRAELAKVQDQLEKGKTVTKEVPPADYADLQREVKELRERPVEVAVEKPADYEPIKAELAELKAREQKFETVYDDIKDLETFLKLAVKLNNSVHYDDAVTFLQNKNAAICQQGFKAMEMLCTKVKGYTQSVETTAVAKPLTRAEILTELKQLAADDKTNQTSAKMREIAREIGIPKSDDMSDAQLLTVLNKIKEWKATNEN